MYYHLAYSIPDLPSHTILDPKSHPQAQAPALTKLKIKTHIGKPTGQLEQNLASASIDPEPCHAKFLVSNGKSKLSLH
jgi:hypothetical protein